MSDGMKMLEQNTERMQNAVDICSLMIATSCNNNPNMMCNVAMNIVIKLIMTVAKPEAIDALTNEICEQIKIGVSKQDRT